MARTPNPTPLLDASFADPEAMAEVLDGHPDYRVLRRLKPRREFGHKRQGEIAKVLILDTETTGLDSSKDRLIELALILVDVDKATGLPLQVQEVFDELEDPGRPIPAEATRVTGITDAMVAGKRLNEERVAELMRETYGSDAALWTRRWRRFYLATAGLFGNDGGRTWAVSHYLLKPVGEDLS